MLKLITGIALMAVSWQSLSALQQAWPANCVEQTAVRVDSRALFFSPGNWSGNEGRRGDRFRQTWNAGAYFRFYWFSESDHPMAKMHFDTSMFGSAIHARPLLTYEVDGKWTSGIEVAPELSVAKLAGRGHHILTVYLQSSEQEHRWGAPGVSGINVLRFTGMQIGLTDRPDMATAGRRWILEVGDSITEGIGANGAPDVLSAYSYLIGQALQRQGFEFSISACGWSGWLRPGDEAGDVPAYFAVSGARAGRGGNYDDAGSRWDKIDANTSLLDARGHLSAYGRRGQEPSIITINYGTNDALRPSSESDLQASITQALIALRQAAPNAAIFVIIPFGQFSKTEVEAAINIYRRSHRDKRLFTIDLGVLVATTLSDTRSANTATEQRGVAQANRSPFEGGSEGASAETVPGGKQERSNANLDYAVVPTYWGGLHPNARAHAILAARILTDILIETNGLNESDRER